MQTPAQGRELERMGALETEWREREAGRAAQAAVRVGELATLEAAARKVRAHPAAQACIVRRPGQMCQHAAFEC